jgi:hypothetical protein
MNDDIPPTPPAHILAKCDTILQDLVIQQRNLDNFFADGWPTSNRSAGRTPKPGRLHCVLPLPLLPQQMRQPRPLLPLPSCTLQRSASARLIVCPAARCSVLPLPLLPLRLQLRLPQPAKRCCGCHCHCHGSAAAAAAAAAPTAAASKAPLPPLKHERCLSCWGVSCCVSFAATPTPATQTARVTEAKPRQPLLVPLPLPPLRCCCRCGCSSDCAAAAAAAAAPTAAAAAAEGRC